ncbi:hypothetical protein [Paenibacillus pini]|uniref:Uncharacterized protein n=1 Tax=Paenibacillus pini JCM 16418 TaxID=1236976 RepID=W7Z7L6_9BACL|nr:hypothetical protein [Paenibacillus pini]GAF10389.1 hypothetical protein JCM16418_4590 [Paenibacillus pini JCM 16418]
MLPYWLQQYAELTQEHAYAKQMAIQWNDKAVTEKARADIAEIAYVGLEQECVSRGEYESLLDKHTTTTKAYREEKERADGLNERLNDFMLTVREATEYLSWRNDGDGNGKALKMIYKWLAENPESK